MSPRRGGAPTRGAGRCGARDATQIAPSDAVEPRNLNSDSLKCRNDQWDSHAHKTENGIATIESGKGAWFKDEDGSTIGIFQRH